MQRECRQKERKSETNKQRNKEIKKPRKKETQKKRNKQTKIQTKKERKKERNKQTKKEQDLLGQVSRLRKACQQTSQHSNKGS